MLIIKIKTPYETFDVDVCDHEFLEVLRKCWRKKGLRYEIVSADEGE